MARSCLLLLSLGALSVLGGCDALQLSVMNAAGPVAENQRHLYIIVAIVLIFVALPVILLTPIMAWHYRLSNKNNAFQPNWNFSWILEAFIWLPPAGIVVGLSFLLWDYTQQLDPYRPIASPQPPVEIQVVALDWKWLFIYPDQQVATINQLAIPAGQPIHISLTSGTVMQSLYIPRLAGQMYAMAGMKTQLNLAADRPGVYRGENVQYNGDGFQNQSFLVLALAPQDFQNWIAQVHETSRSLDEAAYRQLFAKSTPARPVLFSTVQQGLFQRVLARGQTPGVDAPR